MTRRWIALAMVSALVMGTAAAQERPGAATGDSRSYPNRTVRIIVPFPPGGPTDILTRVLGQRMSEVWGQPVVIENQPGANITLASKNTSLLSVRAEDGPKTVKELIARAKASPGKLNYGAGIITTRLAGYLFNREAGLDVQYIPFNGSAPTVQGLLTGAVDYIIDGAATSLPLIHSGKLRALAKLNSRPLPALPEVRPLAVEAAIPALEDISTWIGLVAPAGTPRPVIDKIQHEVARMY